MHIHKAHQIDLQSGLCSLAFCPTGSLIAAGFGVGLVQILSALSMRPLWRYYHIAEYALVTGLTFSPGGTLLASACADEVIRIWNVADRRERKRLNHRARDRGEPHGQSWQEYTAFYPHTLSFSSTGRYLICGQAHGALDAWETTTWQGRWHVQGHRHIVTALSVTSDESVLVSGCYDNTIGFWNLSDGTGGIVRSPHTKHIQAVTVLPSRNLVLTGGDSSVGDIHDDAPADAVHIWNMSTATVEHVLECETPWVESLALHPTGDFVAVGHPNHTVSLWETTTWTHIRTLQSEIQRVQHLKFRADGRVLMIGGWYEDVGGGLELWEIDLF